MNSTRDAGPPLRRVGTGPLVVLIHPGGTDQRFWDRCLPYLAQRLTVATFDRPMHGQNVDVTDVPPPDVSTPISFLAWLDERRRSDVRSEAADLSRTIVDLTEEPVHLVGALDGGLLALQVATERRGFAVDGLVTIDSVVPGIGADPSQVVAAAGLDDVGDLAEIVPSLLRDRDPASYVDWFVQQHGLTKLQPQLLAGLREMIGRNAFSSMLPAPPSASITEADLQSADPRLLVLQSRNRPAHLCDLDEALVAAVPRAGLELVSGRTSFYPMSDPQDFSERVANHLLS